jgi:imidazolonepropionase-like amidohydrolase
MKRSILTTILGIATTFAFAQKTIINGGTIHIGNGKIIENGSIIIEKGKIVDVTTSSTTVAGNNQIINAQGKHIYPGFIAPNTSLGLTEVDAVRATNDFRETGSLNPNVRSQIAYNTDSDIIPTVRFNGVLLAQTTPQGGWVSGSSSIMKLDGWNWEDATLMADDGIHVNWPRMFNRSGWWAEPDKRIDKNKEYENQKDEIRKLFLDAQAYNSTEKPEIYNVKLAVMKSVLDGKRNVYIHVNQMKEIMDAVRMFKDLNIAKIVVVGAKESWKDPQFFVDNKVAIILSRLHDLPGKDHEDVNQSYKTPGILQKAGVLFCLNRDGDMEAMGQRNLPFQAGTAAAHGMAKEDALALITSNSAKILGIDHLVGTIEKGKDATLFISTGDALDMRSNNVENAWISGKQVNLTDNKQYQLYKKYQEKYKNN